MKIFFSVICLSFSINSLAGLSSTEAALGNDWDSESEKFVEAELKQVIYRLGFEEEFEVNAEGDFKKFENLMPEFIPFFKLEFISEFHHFMQRHFSEDMRQEYLIIEALSVPLGGVISVCFALHYTFSPSRIAERHRAGLHSLDRIAIFAILGGMLTGEAITLGLASQIRAYLDQNYDYMNLYTYAPMATFEEDQVDVQCHYLPERRDADKNKRAKAPVEASVWLNEKFGTKIRGKWGLDPKKPEKTNIGFATLSNPLMLLGECAESLRLAKKAPRQIYPDQIFVTANTQFGGGAISSNNYPIYYYQEEASTKKDVFSLRAELLIHVLETQEKRQSALKAKEESEKAVVISTGSPPE